MVRITLRDHGLGIPPGQLHLLFERFVRLPRDLASNVPGNGLGLYLCQTLAEGMGGTIWAESTGVEGEGTVFYIQLPAPPDTTPNDMTQGATPHDIESHDSDRATSLQTRRG